MKTLEQIKDICSRENNIGMSEEEYKIFDKIYRYVARSMGRVGRIKRVGRTNGVFCVRIF